MTRRSATEVGDGKINDNTEYQSVALSGTYLRGEQSLQARCFEFFRNLTKNRKENP